jgi:hypothetical protein
MAKSSQANDRYFTLEEDGSLKQCDLKTWLNDWPNRENARTKITCSPEIEATISFVGYAWSIVHMDENVKLWSASFCITAKNDITAEFLSAVPKKQKRSLIDTSLRVVLPQDLRFSYFSRTIIIPTHNEPVRLGRGSDRNILDSERMKKFTLASQLRAHFIKQGYSAKERLRRSDDAVIHMVAGTCGWCGQVHVQGEKLNLLIVPA